MSDSWTSSHGIARRLFDPDDETSLTDKQDLTLIEANEQDIYEARPGAWLINGIRETLLDVLHAEQDKMQDLLTNLNMKQKEELEAQQRDLKRSLEAQHKSLKQEMESSLEKWANTCGDSLSVSGDNSLTTVGFNLLQGDECKREVELQADGHHETLASRVDAQIVKNKLRDFASKYSGLSTPALDQSHVALCWYTMNSARQRILTSASKRRWHFDRLKRFVDGPYFRGCMMLAIILNAAFIGCTTDVKLKAAIEEDENSTSNADSDSATWQRISTGESSWLLAAELFFHITFVLEISLRVLALEGAFFFGKDASWNVFDLLLTLSSVAERTLVDLSLDLSFLRVLCITRVARSFRVFSFLRLMPFMRSLRLMVLTVVKSIVPFVLAALILSGSDLRVQRCYRTWRCGARDFLHK